MRTLGRPEGSTVASAMALGSFGSERLGLGEPGAGDREGVVASEDASPVRQARLPPAVPAHA